MDKLYPTVNFIGNKEKITNWMFDFVPSDVEVFLDGFSGGASVSYEAKKRNFEVISNDVLKINFLISKALVENNKHKLSEKDIEIIFNGKPISGYMHKNYSNKNFFPEECMELDLYRKNIDKLSNNYKKAMALVLMRRSMIRKMPYSRFNIKWEKVKQLRDEEYSYKHYKRRRAYHNESFKKHFLSNVDEYNLSLFDNGKNNKAHNKDIFSFINKVEADLIYLDPPYPGTLNKYFEFYGLLDEYVDSKEHTPFTNSFTNKNEALKLFDKLFKLSGDKKYMILSTGNKSYPDILTLKKLAEQYFKKITVSEKKHVYKITGKENKKGNKEVLIIGKN
jgi:adenine-specific DNA-methyltransferase